jgi:hypothetical protein
MDAEPTGKPHPVMFSLAFGTIALMVAGSAGPWAYFADESITLTGLSRDGRVTLSLAIGAAILLLAHRQVKGLSIGPLIGTVLVGVICVVILITDLSDIHSKHLASRWGIVVDLVGSALLILASIALIVQAPRRRVATTAQGEASPGTMTAKPADWYPDPHGEARLRYWDGSRWTEHTAP